MAYDAPDTDTDWEVVGIETDGGRSAGNPETRLGE